MTQISELECLVSAPYSASVEKGIYQMGLIRMISRMDEVSHDEALYQRLQEYEG
jgi:hypothetical protein